MSLSVLVVGAGPVGLTMAAELARYGVPVRIIDKAAERTDKSKALVLWSRTLEFMDRMGCAAAFVAAGFKVTAANIVAGNRPLAHVRLDQMETPYPFALMLPQSDTERLMEQHLNACGVLVERRVELTRFAADADKVTATLLHAEGHEETATLLHAEGREEIVQADWMIGCDGAHSAVRHGLELPFEGDTLPSDWILADVHLAGVHGKPDELSIYWHAEGVLAMFPITPGRYRVIADVGDGQTDTHRPDPTLEQVQSIIDRRGPGGIQASSPIWLAAFRINERKVADYRAGRAFLAGDAAHVHSPAGGQGMNTGMQDAFNLAWKLALVCRGLAAREPLLGSYSIERSAVGRKVLKDAGRLTMLAVMRSGLMQAVRNHVASLVFGLDAVRETMANKMAELSIGYPESPLTQCAHPGHAIPEPGQRAPVLHAGQPVGTGNTPRFALFALADAEGAALIARHGELLEPQMRPPFVEGNIWLVRPDGYVALVVRQGNWANVEEYLQRVTGAAN